MSEDNLKKITNDNNLPLTQHKAVAKFLQNNKSGKVIAVQTF